MTRNEWLSEFAAELRKLRPHMLGKVAYTVALQRFDPTRRPQDVALQLDAALHATEPLKGRSSTP